MAGAKVDYRGQIWARLSSCQVICMWIYLVADVENSNPPEVDSSRSRRYHGANDIYCFSQDVGVGDMLRDQLLWTVTFLIHRCVVRRLECQYVWHMVCSTYGMSPSGSNVLIYLTKTNSLLLWASSRRSQGKPTAYRRSEWPLETEIGVAKAPLHTKTDKPRPVVRGETRYKQRFCEHLFRNINLQLLYCRQPDPCCIMHVAVVETDISTVCVILIELLCGVYIVSRA